MGKWVKESEFVYHYYHSDEDFRNRVNSKGEIVALGDAIVERSRSKIFDPLWYAHVFGAKFYNVPVADFDRWEDAKKWVEKQSMED